MEDLKKDISIEEASELRASPPWIMDVETAQIVLGMTEAFTRKLFKQTDAPVIKNGNRLMMITSELKVYLKEIVGREF